MWKSIVAVSSVPVSALFCAGGSACNSMTPSLVITGLCGGLTTFSTFSAEIVAHLEEGRALWACGAAALHLAGSVLMTFAGIGTVAWVKG